MDSPTKTRSSRESTLFELYEIYGREGAALGDAEFREVEQRLQLFTASLRGFSRWLECYHRPSTPPIQLKTGGG
jgi:hypothetical protein